MINQEIYQHTNNNITPGPQVIWGHLNTTNTDYSEGTINFFRLPSSIDQDSGTTLASYQFSVRHTDLYEAYKLKDELIGVWIRFSGRLDTTQVVVFIDSEQGELWEDDDRIVHLPVTINFKYQR